jgi:DNA-binding NarL/FixJ family response regulator
VAKHILIVDDVPAVRFTVRRTLERVPDLQVCGEASDGGEAIEKAAQLSPDLVVMDLSMPTMNGLEATRRIKRNAPHVPVILYTLHKDALSKFDTLSLGISSVVDKGVGIDSLIAAIQGLLKTTP